MLRTLPILLTFVCLVITVAAVAAPPNVVVILTDDQGWGDLSASGNTNLRTPHIDSLARDGVSLDRFYVCAVCAPTRAEFLTGRYHPRTGVRGVSTGQERLNLDERTLADGLKAAGYATGAFGKWHNGSQWPYHPNARGFDEYYGFTSGHWGEYFDPPLDHNGSPVRGKGFIVDDLTDKAMAFIEQHKKGPFFCYVPYNTPHTPWAVPGEYWDRFKDQPLAMTATDPAKEKIEETRCALAMVENLDWNIGRLLAHLEKLGLVENTIVVFFCDNGPNTFRWNGGMKGKKGSTDEGGVRSPCFLRWPGKLPAGRVIKEISGAIDLLPTLAGLTGTVLAGDKPLDGKDLTPLMRGDGKGTAWPARMIFSHQNGNVSVRTQRHRLDAQGVLYDMEADPGQTKGITSKLTVQLQGEVARWRTEMAVPASALAQGGKKGRAKGPVMDPRPYPVGYVEFPRTPLPARDGMPRGGIARSSNAPNCSYFVNWTSLEDSMVWDTEVHTSGTYTVEIQYTCPEADAGSTVELSHGTSRLPGQVTPGWDPPLYTNQDTLPRPPAESSMKEFRTLLLGEIRLEKGRRPLTLRALKIPGRTVMDVRSVVLTLKKSA
jgi:arylsulfatase A-like enzyme